MLVSGAKQGDTVMKKGQNENPLCYASLGSGMTFLNRANHPGSSLEDFSQLANALPSISEDSYVSCNSRKSPPSSHLLEDLSRLGGSQETPFLPDPSVLSYTQPNTSRSDTSQQTESQLSISLPDISKPPPLKPNPAHQCLSQPCLPQTGYPQLVPYHPETSQHGYPSHISSYPLLSRYDIPSHYYYPSHVFHRISQVTHVYPYQNPPNSIIINQIISNEIINSQFLTPSQPLYPLPGPVMPGYIPQVLSQPLPTPADVPCLFT